VPHAMNDIQKLAVAEDLDDLIEMAEERFGDAYRAFWLRVPRRDEYALSEIIPAAILHVSADYGPIEMPWGQVRPFGAQQRDGGALPLSYIPEPFHNSAYSPVVLSWQTAPPIAMAYNHRDGILSPRLSPKDCRKTVFVSRTYLHHPEEGPPVPYTTIPEVFGK
jgi:hypothetical protein